MSKAILAFNSFFVPNPINLVPSFLWPMGFSGIAKVARGHVEVGKGGVMGFGW
ncbi:hypothetical protein Tco_1157533, partial [Tanacetum coccineum]